MNTCINKINTQQDSTHNDSSLLDEHHHGVMILFLNKRNHTNKEKWAANS